jgi:hypothetical protein
MCPISQIRQAAAISAFANIVDFQSVEKIVEPECDPPEFKSRSCIEPIYLALSGSTKAVCKIVAEKQSASCAVVKNRRQSGWRLPKASRVPFGQAANINL